MQIKKKHPSQRLKADEFKRTRSASLTPELFKLSLKQSSFDFNRTKEEILGSTVSKTMLLSPFLRHPSIKDNFSFSLFEYFLIWFNC